MGASEYVGQVYITRHHGKCEIIKYVTAREVTVRFLDTNSTKTTKLCHIKIGAVRDDFSKTTHGVGYIGKGFTLEDKTKDNKAKKLWRGMLYRAYSEKYHITRPTYEECSCSDNFKNLSYFKEWCSNQIGFGEDGFVLDKDVLIKGNKMYSENTCVFLPSEINTLFTLNNAKRGELPIGVQRTKRGKIVARISSKNGQNGMLGYYENIEDAFRAYKTEKEVRIKLLANKWKDKIDPRAYDALINYEVEIDD